MIRNTPHNASEPAEREIVAPVDMCLPNGRLNPAAVGWSRQPMHRANLKGWGRNKRFEYWCVTTPEFVITANISNQDYRANIASTFIDLKAGKVVAYRDNRWLPKRNALDDLVAERPMTESGTEIAVKLTPNAAGTHLSVRAPRLVLDAQVHEDPGHESMGVLVPWSDRLFQYTRKDNGLPVEGELVVDGERRVLNPQSALAIYDHGRGRWPYNTLWNWAAGHGFCNGELVGLQFGGKWTDGTPSTENSVRVGGRVHKISEELEWIYDTSDWMKPWAIRGKRVDIVFTPSIYHRHEFNRWVISARADQCFGYFSGEVVTDDGRSHVVNNVFGIAEEVHRKW